MKDYVAEQAGAGRRPAKRRVKADGYLWAPGGVVSFQRQTGTTTAEDGATTPDLETFSTLYNCVAVYEQGTVGDPEDDG